jgi:hypothetical protein
MFEGEVRNINKQYKNSVFSLLFSDPNILRELYGAIEGVDLAPDVPISINTLTNVLFKKQLNDLSFTVDNRLVVLIEHQSTINPNMPLRLLLYVARVYEKIIEMKKLYARKLVRIPRPIFIVLYNGPHRCPDRMTLKLSDAFKEAEGLLDVDGRPLDLELILRVYNINPGHNAELLKKCEELNGYSVFVDKVREYVKTIPGEKAAFKKAISDCIEQDILREFLKLHSSEVLNMLLEEWKLEDALEAEREDAWEEGREDKAREIAKSLLALGMNPATIAEAAGLPIETVQEIAATLGV